VAGRRKFDETVSSPSSEALWHRLLAPSHPMVARSERASQVQRSGFMRLLTLGSNVHRASSAAGSSRNGPITEASTPTPPASANDLLIAHMRAVEAELLCWEQYEWTGNDTLGTVSLVEFWKVTMDVLPVQASSVSSERAFSSSKFTCTPEHNRISEKHMEYLQVLKHSLHRRSLTRDNNQTLDFMAHIIDPDGDMAFFND
ncbi:unnamed protein product, partial [Rhizoctonia solani]